MKLLDNGNKVITVEDLIRVLVQLTNEERKCHVVCDYDQGCGITSISVDAPFLTLSGSYDAETTD